MPQPTRQSSPSLAAFTFAGVLAGGVLFAVGLLASVGASSVEATPQAAGVAAADEFPLDWYYIQRSTKQRYPKPVKLEGKPAPELKLRDWVGKPVTLEELKGKVVVVDFWATWCRPCVQALPKNVQMVKDHGKDALAVVGIHDSRRGSERMAAVARQVGLNYPTAVDDGGVSVKAWKVDMWPTYAVIDHKGIVRAAGLHPIGVENVVKILLEERKRDL